MNGLMYQGSLDEKLELFMRQHGTTHLLQDRAPYHKSKIVSSPGSGREDPHPGDRLAWQQSRPQHVENAWSWMKKQLFNTNKATNIEEW
jgi:hypothetical protein